MRSSDWRSDVCSSDLDGERDEGCGGEDGVGGVGVEAAQALGQGVVEGAQGAGAPEGVEERGVVHGDGFSRSDTPSPQPLSRTRERRSGSRGEGSSEPPENNASSAWIKSGSTRHPCTPCTSPRLASSPRQNTWRTTPP